MVELIHAGMDVARLNFSHGTHQEHLAVINLLKEAREQTKHPLAIMLDTKGPEIRVGKLKNKAWSLEKGNRLLLVDSTQEGEENRIPITPGDVLKALKPGMTVLFDNGYIISTVVESSEEGVIIEIENQGILESNKGVNIPKASYRLPAMTERDISDIKFGCENNIDIIAASFICSAEHVLSIKRFLMQQGKPDILVLAKIENTQGVDDLDNIIQVSDGIMVARGDLGVEVPLSEVPRLQKIMIRKCIQVGKPVITATQMLESMITKPRPTRAEVSDVANAIYDSSSAVMLSGETAVGKYPIETVQMMQATIQVTENDFDYAHFFANYGNKVYHDVTSSIAFAAVHTAYNAQAKAIFMFTASGLSARLISRLRPKIPIIAMTSNIKVYHQLSVNWGIIPIYAENITDPDICFEKIKDFALEHSYVTYGDLIVMITGNPFAVAGTTNTMLVKSIGNVLARGEIGAGDRIDGQIVLSMNLHRGQETYAQDKVLLLTKCDKSYLPFIKVAKGVILQNHIDDHDSVDYLQKIAKDLNVSILTNVDGAASVLKEEQIITLDPQQKLIYDGIVNLNKP
jgi:pyruvate kinase